MNCPACGAPNEGASEHCFRCGKTLFALTEGTVVAGRYELRQMLGRGGMGIVYRAFDKALEEEVALKILRPDVASMADLTRRFRSEIKLARRVRHRNVCGIHEYGQDGPIHFIAMELVQGTDLKRQMQKHGRFPTAEAWDVAIQIAEGLDAIHHADVVHRDLKAHNIMRDARGVVRVMDFGIAKALGVASGGATVTGQIIGTPEYMSPEQARGEHIDLRSDIYALGVVIFELFTGDVPFHGDTPIATLFKHIQEPPPIETVQGIPTALVPVLQKALAKDPADRYDSAHALSVALREARAAAGVAGTESTIMLPATAVPGATIHTPVPPAQPTRPPMPPTRIGPPRATASPPPPPPPRPARTTPPPQPPSRDLALPLLVALGLLGVALVAGAILLWSRSRAVEVAGPAPATTTLMAAPPVEPSLAPEPTVATTLPAADPTPPATPAPRADRPTPFPTIPPPPTTRPVLVPVTRPPAPTPAPTRPPTVTPAVVQGTVRVRVVPWAYVEVDGVRRGSTPLRPFPLPPGPHTLRFVHPDFRPLIKRIIVRADETVTVEVDLAREAFPR